VRRGLHKGDPLLERMTGDGALGELRALPSFERRPTASPHFDGQRFGLLRWQEGLGEKRKERWRSRKRGGSVLYPNKFTLVPAAHLLLRRRDGARLLAREEKGEVRF
jgi:hypothetical protein